MKHYISVTIGRNYGERSNKHGQPICDSLWDCFKQSIRDSVTICSTVEGVVFDGEGKGLWGNQTEEAFTLSAIVSDYDSDALGQILRLYGSAFYQDAVAFVAVPLPQGNETLINCTK